MAKSAQGLQWTGYAGTATMLVLALLFPDRPDGLRPHPHVRAGLGAVRRDGHLLLGRRDASAASSSASGGTSGLSTSSPSLLKRVNAAMARTGARDGSPAAPSGVADDDSRILPVRIRQLLSFFARERQPVGDPAHGGQPRRLRPRPGADGRPVHADALYPLSLARDWVYRHRRGHLAGPDEYQQGAADGEEPRRFSRPI